MKVVLSRLALAELDEILTYIATRSPRGARNVEARFRHAFKLIGRYPAGAERLEQRPQVAGCRSGDIPTRFTTRSILKP